MPVETAHNARHVDTFFICLKAHGPGNRCFQTLICPIAALISYGKSEIGNANVLDLPVCTANERTWTVLKIRHLINIGRIGDKIVRIGSIQFRVLRRQKPCKNRRIRGDSTVSSECATQLRKTRNALFTSFSSGSFSTSRV